MPAGQALSTLNEREKERRANIARHLGEARQKTGMTQKEVADATGYPAPSVSDWERGTRTPNIFVLWDLADLYEITIDELVRGVPTKANGVSHEAEQVVLMSLLRRARGLLAESNDPASVTAASVIDAAVVVAG